MQRTITFRIDPTNKKARLLKKLSEEMGDLANYIVDKYEEEMKGKAKPTKSRLDDAFIYSDPPFDLGKQTDFISKTRHFQSIVSKIKPNLVDYDNGRINKPSWDGFLYFSTRLVEFTKTDSGYWGILINHPNKRDEYVFIKCVENERNDEKIEEVKEYGAEETFTCEIYRNFNGKWILSVMVDIGKSPETSDDIKNIIGVDLGLRFVATATVYDREKEEIKDVEFFKGGKLFEKRKELSKRMSELQEIGNKKAYDRLKNKDGEITKHKNHKISKELVELAEEYDPSVIVFEDLKGSKKGMKEESFKESGDIKGKVGRFKNRILSFWSPSMLRRFVEYKAEEKGIDVYEVESKYTSQECPKCGYTDRSNRKKSEHRFICQECGYEINDDLVGAINVAKRGDSKISE